jgi:hypothetical protein
VADLDLSQFPEYRQIKLTQGYAAIVDAENYEWLNQFKWHAIVQQHTVYAASRPPRINGKSEPLIFMHCQIVNTPKGMLTDHRDSNGLMNTWENLRVCTDSQNQGNIRPRLGTTSSNTCQSFEL